MPTSSLNIVRKGAGVLLEAPAWSLHLKAGAELRACRWDNHLTGRSIDLGQGPELQVELDTAARRLWIEGWRGKPSQVEDSPPNGETGFQQGYWRPELDDSAWQAAVMPSIFCYRQPHTWYWARTHLFLPEDCRGQDLTLVLGGLGLYDYRYTRVFINGQAVGTRRTAGGWHEPGRFHIGHGTAIHKHLRFGRDNVIALQLAGPICRTRKLDQFDRRKVYHLPWPWVHPGQYEQYVVVGTPTTPAVLRVREIRHVRRNGLPALAVTLRARRAGLEAESIYGADPSDPVLRRTVTLRNIGRCPVRVMDIHLGHYLTDTQVSEGYMGFPVYMDGQFFASLAHPAGWAIGQDGCVSLRQYAGTLLEPGQSFECMEAVLGVSQAGQAQQAFVSHLQGRMRRTVRGHDKPLAIFETFGGWNLQRPDLVLSENLPGSYCLDMVRRLEGFGRQTGMQFDIFSLEFWADPHGDLRQFNPANFPQGFHPLQRALKRAGIAPGMWITSSTGGWNIGRNPVVAGARAENPSYPTTPGECSSLCTATEPFHSMLVDGMVHQITGNGGRLVKIDGGHCVCYNVAHEHLPGLYSTQAIYDGTICLLRAMDRACPDAFLMLYWGHSSPWWLLHADTLCESGLHMEAASPSPWPTLHARDGVTVSLDQAQEYCGDVPPLGKDSLGIWLSDWHWNSNIGSHRWAEGMVMDLCRGSLLLQPWTDRTWLTPPDRRRFARFLELLRERPECFRNSHRILGSAWKQQPYGYCCTDGRRAFIAINNPTWNDARVQLRLDGSWGLAGQQAFDLYRHYPQPARLGEWSGNVPGMFLRPFQVVLLEAVPRGHRPSGSRRFPTEAVPEEFRQSSLEVALRVRKVDFGEFSRTAASKGHIPADKIPPSAGASRATYRLAGQLPPLCQEGTVVVSAELSRSGGVFPVTAVDCMSARAKMGGRARRLQTVLTGRCYPVPWQAWRMTVKPSAKPQPFELLVSSALPQDVHIQFAAHFVPDSV
jgi:hypothetical protein